MAMMKVKVPELAERMRETLREVVLQKDLFFHVVLISGQMKFLLGEKELKIKAIDCILNAKDAGVPDTLAFTMGGVTAPQWVDSRFTVGGGHMVFLLWESADQQAMPGGKRISILKLVREGASEVVFERSGWFLEVFPLKTPSK